MIRGTALAVVVALWAGCGGSGAVPDPGTENDASVDPIDSGGGDGGDSGTSTDGGSTPTLVWQPGYRTALRASEAVSSTATFRMKIRTVRAGNRLRLTFRAGSGALSIFKANVARAGTGGNLVGAPSEVTFSGTPGTALAAGATVVSDPVTFSVAKGDELYVSYELQGATAISGLISSDPSAMPAVVGGVSLLPDSFRRAGQFSQLTTGFGGTAEAVPHALAGIDVEAVQLRMFIAIGDSITEGYVSGNDDYRNSWPVVASGIANPPVVSAAVSGQGVQGALDNVASDVLLVNGITDCVLLIGTNDLQSDPSNSGIVDQIKIRMTQLFAQLEPKCNVWVSTLLPKESVGTTTSGITVLQMTARRNELNTWIRSRSLPLRVIDLEAAVRDPSSPNDYAPGYSADGIHPSVAGQAKLGQTASAAFQ